MEPESSSPYPQVPATCQCQQLQHYLCTSNYGDMTTLRQHFNPLQNKPNMTYLLCPCAPIKQETYHYPM
jgi:hypothetical protein